VDNDLNEVFEPEDEFGVPAPDPDPGPFSDAIDGRLPTPPPMVVVMFEGATPVTDDGDAVTVEFTPAED
jgi:hypothetical protein